MSRTIAVSRARVRSSEFSNLSSNRSNQSSPLDLSTDSVSEDEDSIPDSPPSPDMLDRYHPGVWHGQVPPSVQMRRQLRQPSNLVPRDHIVPSHGRPNVQITRSGLNTLAEASGLYSRDTDSSALQRTEVNPNNGVLPPVPTTPGNTDMLFPPTLTFDEACELMGQSNMELYSESIKERMNSYSLRIHGFPPCPEKDLLLAGFFFLEQYFDCKPDDVQMCVRGIDKKGPNSVGVVLRNVSTVTRIMKERKILKKTCYRIHSNRDFTWIAQNL